MKVLRVPRSYVGRRGGFGSVGGWVPLGVWRGFGAAAPPASITAQITAAAIANGVPPDIAIGIAAHESGGIATAQNPGSSACGIFQLTAATQQTLGVTNCTDPTQNINAGVGLLASYYQQYGNWPDAIQAFSDGPGTVGVSAPSAQTLQLESYLTQNYGVDLSSTAPALDLSSIVGSDTPVDLSALVGEPAGSLEVDPLVLAGGAALLVLGLFLAFRNA
jgi:soluble lytic murein transglycosylase-like protein